MTIEMSLLLWSVVIGLLQCLATGFAVTLTRGVAFGGSARDDQKPIQGIGGRVIRAFNNFRETFPFFAALVLAGAVLHRHSALTVIGANLYFWSRVIYWPLYVTGVPMIRSLIWLGSLLGLILLLIGVAGIV
ncbi:MAPEG family protein [Acidisoma cellulosilytica]|uniref:MAPEG family protein n=1 Tax=Acidisoma cellulosilyticum TaxID=2802395 RepID=A0A963Z1F9_9PROT|nr:MAPEG family protein [Acidisoma cellulosilyticum]MCB8880896.1 MAPEG family protein [Acidisoma cellulosilyticum]